MEKACTKCKRVQDFSCFGKASREKDGLQDWCKDCHRDWRQANRARIQANRADYFDRNKDTIRAKDRARGPAKYRKNKQAHRAAVIAWFERHPGKGAEYTARYRARRLNAPRIEKVDRAYIYERDGGICHLCRRKVSKRTFTVDHLVPLSKGGDHTHDNLAVAHHSCNSGRRDGLKPAQLLLIG